ncbi:hypothetical protein [Rhizobium leguminosarum]|uniref:hypothetical protein n=1 Tax=Rhizobium leguminosarum TaxID=384 RepID=UPI001C9809EA|nr:hypothetical protein [Rhizobium leguminosarum]MBY5821433.1 hypothetical protein [Rhizobium leguminosarum]
MADIVHRLRAVATTKIELLTMLREAADEIAELRARCEKAEAALESGQQFANQVRSIVYKLQGQAYSSTVSELNQFDADLRRARDALSQHRKRSEADD